jgi:hypothetical protein
MTPGRKKVKVSRFDGVCYKRIRQNVSRFLCSQARAKDRYGALILDIAPQEHEGAAYYFKKEGNGR